MTGPDAGQIFIGAGTSPAQLTLRLANRHGLIAGATGTGKTVTLQVLAEGFADAGVPVFLSDVKGDLSGMCLAGKPHPRIDERIAAIGLEHYEQRPAPVVFWDLFGDQGHPIRTTVSEMGPLLLSRLLDLTDAQEGTLSIVFQVADDEGLLLLDLKDLRSLLQYVSEEKDRFSDRYGSVNKASVGAILRRLLTLEQQGGAMFFGEPALDLRDFMRTDFDGRGFVNILAADKLMMSPRLYATFLLWLLSELFEELPEVGDPEKPRLVFFFDEAHLLFDDAPKALADKVEQVVRLIRSKGVGVYFVSQSPMDIPDDVLGQLGNRVQHALRAFTPRDQKAIRAAADTFRRNPDLDVETALTELGVGEALVSNLEGKGSPSVVQRVLIRPPASQMGPASEAERKSVLDGSPVRGRYDTALDRESAYEMLLERAEKVAEEAELAEREATSAKRARQEKAAKPRGRSNRLTTTEVVMREVGRTLGREIIRGILGSIFKRR